MLTLFRNLFTPPRHTILMVIAAWIGLLLAEKRSEQHGVSKDHLNNLTYFSLIGFVIGGRISFVLQNLPAFIKSPLGLFSINPDIFDPLGAAAVAFLIAFIYGQRQNISFWTSLDALTPFFAILSIGSGLSHLAAGTAFGKTTDVIWGINLWNADRHPTQIYETLASLLTFILVWFKKPNSHRGVDFLTFAALSVGFQLFIQGFRGDGQYIFNGIRQSQVISLILLGIIFFLIEKQLNIKTKNLK